MRPGLKTGVENDIFGSEIRAGFGVPGGTPPPRFPRSTPSREQNSLKTSCTFLLPVLLYLYTDIEYIRVHSNFSLSFFFLKRFYQIKQSLMQPYSQFPCFAPSFTTQNIAISRPGGGYFLVSRLVLEWIRYCHPM